MRPLRAGERAVWLLEIQWAGRTWRFASETLEVGGVTYLGSLAGVQLRQELTLFSSTPAPASVPFEVVWPESIATLLARGHDLAAATATLSMHVVGRTVDATEVMIRGRIVEPLYDEWLDEHGHRHATVTATVEEQPWTDTGVYPASTQVVSATTWPDRATEYDGRVYPLPFGRPGLYRDPANALTYTRGSPALVVVQTANDNDILLIAGERVVAELVGIYYQDDTEPDGWGLLSVQPVVHTQDALGQVVATVDLTSLGTGTVARTSSEYWVLWNIDGGIPSPRVAGEAMSGLGDLLVWFLTRSTGVVDHGRIAAIVPWLNRWKVSGYVDEQVVPWTWIADNLLPLVPVSVASGPNGLYLVPWRWGAERERAELRWTEQAGHLHVSPVAYQGAPWERVNERVLRWAVEPALNEYLRATTLTPSPNDDDPDHVSCLVVRQSASRLSTLPGDELTSDVVCDRDTAASSLLWRAHRDALAWRRVTLDLPSTFAHARRGHRILVFSDHLLLDCIGDVVAVEIDDHMRVRLDVELGAPVPTTGTSLPLDDDPLPPEQ